MLALKVQYGTTAQNILDIQEMNEYEYSRNYGELSISNICKENADSVKVNDELCIKKVHIQ